MRLFTLPWPDEELRKLGKLRVTLRVALSSFIAPNPSEPARGTRYRYASHNLRLKLNRAGENAQQFLSRISKAIENDCPEHAPPPLRESGTATRDRGLPHPPPLTPH